MTARPSASLPLHPGATFTAEIKQQGSVFAHHVQSKDVWPSMHPQVQDFHEVDANSGRTTFMKVLYSKRKNQGGLSESSD
jgi:hypothetical protein